MIKSIQVSDEIDTLFIVGYTKNCLFSNVNIINLKSIGITEIQEEDYEFKKIFSSQTIINAFNYSKGLMIIGDSTGIVSFIDVKTLIVVKSIMTYSESVYNLDFYIENSRFFGFSSGNSQKIEVFSYDFLDFSQKNDEIDKNSLMKIDDDDDFEYDDINAWDD